MNIRFNRREFLKRAALVSSIGLAPEFLARAAQGVNPAVNGFRDDRVLVVVQLGGGNDGLNTLVPYADDNYYRMRPQIGLKQDRLIRVDDTLAVNDRLAELYKLYENGQVAMVQGVGYPNPDRSHFRSMEIWHTASSSEEYLGTGWIGRYFDNCCSGTEKPQAGVAIGQERPQAFHGERGLGISCDRPDRFGWQAGTGFDTDANFAALNSGVSERPALDFLRHTTSDAIVSSAHVREAAGIGGYDAAQARNPLMTVAALLRGGLGARIYYVSVGGFDTHANQLGVHDNLLTRFATAMAEFQNALKRDGLEDRVLTMVFSEFGRRVGENASRGTDHGTAAPLFLVGKQVNPGLYGAAPSLSDLDDGDLKHTVDFRAVYASVLQDWFNVDPAPVLLETFPTLPLIA